MASIFDSQLMSKTDLERMEQIQAAYNATDDKKLKNDLHARAESIRMSYGYSGGEDGSRYIPYDESVAAAAASSSNYIKALNDAQNHTQKMYENQITDAENDGKDRLREAYIKNMQSKLGLDEKLKADGVTGGISETTVADIDNNYNVIRDGIKKDTDKTKRDIEIKAKTAKHESDTDIAKAEYQSALERNDRLTDAKQREYERKQDALEWQYKTDKDKYQREQDAADREYQKEQDAREWEYREKEYQLDKKQLEQSKANASSSAYQKQVSNILTLMKNGYYSDEFADILGLDGLEYTGNADSDAASAAWKLLNKGVYDESFPELLGYSEDILRQYAENVLSGF